MADHAELMIVFFLSFLYSSIFFSASLRTLSILPLSTSILMSRMLRCCVLFIPLSSIYSTFYAIATCLFLVLSCKFYCLCMLQQCVPFSSLVLVNFNVFLFYSNEFLYFQLPIRRVDTIHEVGKICSASRSSVTPINNLL